jgi:hypothetical protein
MNTTERHKSLFDRVLTWPLEQQERAVEALALIEARRGEVYGPDDEEWAAINEGLVQIDSGDVVTDAEMEAVWKRFGG